MDSNRPLPALQSWLIVAAPVGVTCAALDAAMAEHRWRSPDDTEPEPPLARTCTWLIGERSGATVIEARAERDRELGLDSDPLLETLAPLLSARLGCRCAFMPGDAWEPGCASAFREWDGGAESLVFTCYMGDSTAIDRALLPRPHNQGWLDDLIRKQGGASPEELLELRLDVRLPDAPEDIADDGEGTPMAAAVVPARRYWHTVVRPWAGNPAAEREADAYFDDLVRPDPQPQVP